MQISLSFGPCRHTGYLLLRLQSADAFGAQFTCDLISSRAKVWADCLSHCLCLQERAASVENKPLPASPRRWLESVETTAPRSEQHRTHESLFEAAAFFTGRFERHLHCVGRRGLRKTAMAWHASWAANQNRRLRAEQEAAWQHL